MMLCDHCDAAHHIYCLSPPLKKVPEESWVCPRCTNWLMKTGAAVLSATAEDEARLLVEGAGIRKQVQSSVFLIQALYTHYIHDTHYTHYTHYIHDTHYTHYTYYTHYTHYISTGQCTIHSTPWFIPYIQLCHSLRPCGWHLLVSCTPPRLYRYTGWGRVSRCDYSG